MAVIALVCGIVSWFMPCAPAIPGIIIGKMELNKIERGESPVEGKTFAQIGFWLSAVHLGLAVVGICLYICFFVFVIGLSAAAPHGHP
jgi:hypothetical protein